MITVIALSQLAFLSLGVAFLKIMVRAHAGTPSSPLVDFLNTHWPWFFLIPLAWIAYARICLRVNRAPLSPGFARAIGVVIAAVFFVFFVALAFFPRA